MTKFVHIFFIEIATNSLDKPPSVCYTNSWIGTRRDLCKKSAYPYSISKADRRGYARQGRYFLFTVYNILLEFGGIEHERRMERL